MRKYDSAFSRLPILPELTAAWFLRAETIAFHAPACRRHDF